MTLALTARQREFLSATEAHVLFCGGVGSGKTWAGALWSFFRAIEMPGVGFIGANTERQLARATLKTFVGLLMHLGIDYVLGSRPPRSWGKSAFPSHDHVLSFETEHGMAQVIVGTLSNYDAHRGIEIRWFWMDETRDTKQEAFDVLLGRLRGFGDVPYPVAITTTPAGFTWLYDRFVTSSKRLPDSRIVTCSTFENPYNPREYAAGLLHKYSARMARQEVYGQFINLAEGQAYAEFDRSRNVSQGCEYNPKLELIHTWDFNVNPLCSVILQSDGLQVWAIDEIHIEGSARTADATEEFVRRYAKHPGTVKVYGDYSGNSRSTRGTVTDYDMIEAAYAPTFGDRLQMCNIYTNPGIFDSVQAVNAMLLNASGETRLRLHPRCDYTIRDLEQVSFMPGTRTFDKTNEQITHHSDALRYYVAAEFPIGGPAVGGFG